MTGLNMTDAQLAAETRHLQKKLKDLEKGLEGMQNVPVLWYTRKTLG